MKYEYMNKNFKYEINLEVLNKLGEDGWLMVSDGLDPDRPPLSDIYCIFAREVVESEILDCADLRVNEDQPDLSFLDVGSN